MSTLTKLVMLTKKIFRDFLYPLKYSINNVSLDSGFLYYFDFNESELLKGGSQKFLFDSEGVPLLPHYLQSSNTGTHYYPISIGQYALAIYHEYQKFKKKEDLKRFLNLANWFVTNQNQNGFWYSHTDMSKFQLSQPWVSAMAQGRAISVLTRAFHVTDERKYLNSALKALETFSVKTKDGGITTVLGVDSVFYQEYPGKTNSFVLNGAIFALWGLYDLYLLGEEGASESKEYFKKGVNGVLSKIESYDIGFWTKYDLYPKNGLNACTSHYHDIHIKQMKVMHQLTKENIFKEKYELWSDYDCNINLLKAYFYKISIVYKRLTT